MLEFLCGALLGMYIQFVLERAGQPVPQVTVRSKRG